MKALYLKKYGAAEQAFELKETVRPTISDNEVLIKNSCFGLNFADVVARNGLYPDAPKNPALLGYDVTGYIEAVGAKVKDLKVGDRVAALTRFGGYAEYSKTMQEGVVVLPETIGLEVGTALATQACSGVGSILTQIAKHKGCTVFGTASSSKLDFLKENGVDYPIDYRKVEFSKAISDQLGGNKLDVVFDSIGGKAFKQGWKLLQPGGTMVNFGAAAQIGGSKLKSLGVAAGFGIFSPLQLLMSSKSMIAVNMLRIADNKPHIFKKTFQGVIEMAEKGIIRPTIAKVYEAEALAEAHKYLESRQSIGKIVLKW